MALQQAGLQWVNDGLGGFLSGVGQANRAMQDTGEAANNAGSRMSPLSGVIQGIAQAMTTFLLDAFVKVGKAMVGLVTDSIGLAESFESMSTRLEIAGRGAATQAGIALDDLSEAALKVGGDTRLMGVSATGAAQAITDLLKAGLSVDDVMGDFNAYMREGAQLSGVLGASVRMASASELNMVETSKLASTTMTIFGLNAADVGNAMDYIVRGADSSVASVTDIRDALEGAGPTLRGFGFSLEDSVDALSLLSNAGIKGAEAGTALRSAFTQMASNKDKVITAFKEQGVSITNAAGEFLSFKEILAQLEIATETMTEAERANFLQTIAGAYGKTALTALINQGTEAYDKYTASLQNAAGIEMQSTEMAKTLGAAQEALKGNIETLRIQIGSVFLPTLANWTRGLSEVIDLIGPVLAPVLDRAGKALTELTDRLFGAALGGVELGQVGDKIGSVLKDFFWMVDVGVEPLKSLQMALTAAFGQETADKIMGVVTKITDAVANIKEKFGVVKAWVETNWPAIRDTVVEVFGRVMEVFNAVKTWVDQNWPTIQAVILTAWTVIGNIIDSVIATVRPAIESLQEAFGKINPETASNAFKIFGDIVKGVAAVIGALFVAAIAVVTSAINALIVIVEEVITGWEWFMETIQEGIDAFKKGDIKQGLEKFSDLLLGAFIVPIKLIIRTVSTFIDSIIKFFKNLSDKLVGKSIIPDMMNAIFGVIDRVLNSIISIVNAWVNVIVNFFSDLAKTVLKVWNDLWDAVAKAITTAVVTIAKIINDFISAVQKLWSDFKATLEKQWSDLWDNVKSAISTAWINIVAAVSTGLQNIINKITQYTTQLIQKGHDIVNNIKDGLVEEWINLVDTIGIKIDEIVVAITEKANVIVQTGRDIVTNLKNGFVEWWTNKDGLIEAIKTKFKNIKADLESVWVWIMGVGSEIIAKMKKGIETAWDLLVIGLRNLIANDKTGIIKAVIDAAGKIGDAGARIIGYIKTGINKAWDDFVAWLKTKIIGIFGGSEPKDSSSPFRKNKLASAGGWIGETFMQEIQRGMAAFSPQIYAPEALPVMGSSMIRDVNNSRSVNVEVNANYANAQSEASIYYDVVAALSGARI